MFWLTFHDVEQNPQSCLGGYVCKLFSSQICSFCDTKRHNQSNIPRGEISTKEVLELVTHKYYSCHSSAYSSRIDLLYQNRFGAAAGPGYSELVLRQFLRQLRLARSIRTALMTLILRA
jgi:hypothetical protein